MSNKTTEEETKKKTAKRVIAEKRKYFVPDRGEVEATSLEDAHKQSSNQEEEVGDAN